jgi:hypothetical protein
MNKFEMKACMIDISRFRVPKVERMKIMLKNIAGAGYDTVFFNIEHTFKIPDHPSIGFEADGYDMKNFEDINRYAAGLELSLVPLIQSFGHMFHILKWDEYENIAESDMKWSVSMSDASYKLIDDLYRRAAELFNSNYIHIGGDEVYDMATGKSAHLLKYATKENLFLNHILNLKDIAARYGKKIVLWGDMIQKDPEVMKKLGSDTVVCYWNYDFKEMPESYKNIDAKILVCPGTNTWKSFFPRYDYALRNFQLMKERAEELHAFGFMITDWGDAGHIHPFSITENMFNLAFKVFNSNQVDKYYEKDEINNILHKLDEVHYADCLNAECVRNKPEYVTKLLFHDNPFSGKCFADQTADQFSELLKRINAVEEALTGVNFETEFEKDIKLFADQTVLFKKKIELHLAIRKNEGFTQIKKLSDEFIVSLRRWFATFMANWLENSQPMGLYFHIHFEKKIEEDIIYSLQMYKDLDYADIPKKALYDDPEYLNLFSVGSANALKTLWNNALL